MIIKIKNDEHKKTMIQYLRNEHCTDTFILEFIDNINNYIKCIENNYIVFNITNAANNTYTYRFQKGRFIILRKKCMNCSNNNICNN